LKLKTRKGGSVIEIPVSMALIAVKQTDEDNACKGCYFDGDVAC